MDKVLLFLTSCKISTTHVSCSIDLCDHVQMGGARGTHQYDRYDWGCGSIRRAC